MRRPAKQLREIERRFERFISNPAYPCVGAKSAVAQGQVEYYHGSNLCSAWDDLALIMALQEFGRRYRRNPRLFTSFVAIFDTPVMLNEAAFERNLWARVQSLHDKDMWLSSSYDERVSPDPDSPDFALSIGGNAFFIVGLHPRASRKARRFEKPTLVFNLHDQFHRLRADGRYEKMRKAILGRDERWSGSVNPMLARHGSVSEARQYSGRKVDEDWKCPFNPRTGEKR
ncbi:YqcI/YcgG family protein [Parasphingopyxis sp. GrpM-11]|uniref:YqcI/YcgG family protein n=1 Tax=Parasphingopyxis marina TaxID=2761622 RepID=A0A842I1A9_9SPHN|nr:YqcI/YcgG family protein [Parasphingopyxis marina]